MMASHFKRVTLGVDFSDNSTKALNWVTERFSPSSTIDLVHSVEVPRVPGFIRHAFPRFEEWEKNHMAGAEARLSEFGSSCTHLGNTDVMTGRPDENLISASSKVESDLIAVGAQGEHHGLGKLVGSTPVRLLEHSKTPVLVVREASDRPLKRILVAIDDSPMCAPVLFRAGRAAASAEASLTLMTVTPTWFLESMKRHGGGASVASLQEQQENQAKEWLNATAKQNELDYSDQIVRSGSPDIEILNVAKEIDADMIVMGTKGSSQLAHPFVGSCARHVLANAPCPVLFVIG